MQPLHRRLFTTPLTATEAAAASGIAAFAAQDRLAAPEGRPRWHPWAWGAALLLHVLAIAIVLLVRSRPPVQEGQSPPAVSVVFDNGGTASQPTAPPVMRQGPPQPAEAPPAAAPPPPPPPQTQAEVNLNMPQNPLAELPSTPQTQPKPVPRQRQAAHPNPHPTLPQHYVMMDGMSYGTPSTSTASPSASRGKGMNLSLPQNDTQAVTGADFAVHGDAGADWDAALTKWVSEHAYYPQAAIEQHQQGTAEVEFTVDRHGHVTGLRLLRSADSTFLDQAWELLFADNQLPPFPADAKDDHVTVDYTVHYQLVP
ncbi:energy transducer TonB [Acidocella aromatica]|uniref:Protein TonB n=1 Tax=Acidocella aromatica TaxID=1303579 RepID=A0A840VG04_9PROT|nr:energy transducer TonB [Acidocella aromatica]MBB5372145.1 protein TonB [Acidocella aromatica]